MASPTRLDQLDGIRGLAAFAVFMAHCIGMLSMEGFGDLIFHLLEKIKWLAVPAVDLFFVLSGFCLMYSVEKKALNLLSVSQFVAKRVLRIYPTYLASVLFTLLCRQMFYRPDSLSAMSEWFQVFWSSEFRRQDMVDHVLLIFSLDSSGLNPVLWTLVVEMRMSLVFPLIAWMLRPGGGAASGLALLAICVASLTAPTEAFRYFPLFVLGAAAAKYRDVLTGLLPTSLTLSLLLLAVPALLLVGIRSTVYPGIMAHAKFVHLAIGFLSAYVILLSAARARLNRFLRSRSILFLGRISYSFYLLHFPVLLTASMVLAKSVPVMAIWGMALFGSGALAWVSYKHVEIPSQQLGRWVSSRLAACASVRDAPC